jgi:hypothetical protein
VSEALLESLLLLLRCSGSEERFRVGRETVSCPLGIHDSRRGEGRSGARSGPRHGQAEGQSVTLSRHSVRYEWGSLALSILA